ncbi:MAG: Lrp/AsnC family transcriptional regulator [Silicimonas sp.]|nr:Lrp/AsnC family transcriptional regulator [Silicimonas sp.]
MLKIRLPTEAVHLSRNACWRRGKRFEEAGVIRATTEITRIKAADISASFAMEGIKGMTELPV